ncbi:phosphotransferase family protein [Tumebacillus flagellatus]|uniref:Aminoglycoside phosphotransferase domain-containing protein n=1 Tax=Tumebacillus flagellatus TaxID=1157490 RepID=A0A074LRR1_9BACL|nr:aminoglycoside phosphotransferase family protein [Tumebacillus flagellatus]KEO84836.1 hypothetical protein EL26_02160 [Tumebacillus flagellatus]
MSSLGEMIGQGRTAEVYAWGDGKILKLYREGFPTSWVDYEFRVAQAVNEAGVQAPLAYERVSTDGREGIVYERLEGGTLLEALHIGWSPQQIGEALADLHAGMHAVEEKNEWVPSLRARLESEIAGAQGVSEDVRAQVLDLLANLSDGRALLHGDFHPENVLLTTTRGPVVIDWVTVVTGHPLADVARTSLLLSLAQLPPGLDGNPVIEAMRQTIHDAYLARYQEVTGTTPADLLPWQIVSAASRLSESLPDAELERVRGFLEANLNK